MLISSMPVEEVLNVGSIPTVSTISGCRIMVITPDFQSGDEVSTTSTRSNGPDADGRLTDLRSDHLGSIPTVSTKKLKKRFGGLK